MHSKLIVVLCLMLLFSAQTNADGHRIKFTIKGLPEESAIIGFHLGERQHAHDTVYFDDEYNAVLEGDEELPKGIYFVYTPSLYIEFLVVEQEFELETTLGGGYEDMSVSGSRENQLFQTFQKTMIDLQRQQRLLTDSLSRSSGEDSIQVREQLIQLSRESDSFRDSLISNNQDSFFSKVIQLMRPFELPDFEEIEDEEERQKKKFYYYKNHYFDMVDDPADLLRTPVFSTYVLKYFDDLVLPRPDSVIKEIDWWMDEASGTQASFRFWVVTFFKKYQESTIMGMDKVWVHIAENYYLNGEVDWLSDDAIETIQKEIRFIKPNLIGNYAPAFSVVDTTLNSFQISQMDDEFLVLFFYDPDCGHCRKKTPELRDTYEQIQAMGGEVVGICTTSDIPKWKKFVKEFELTWVNVADPQGKSNFRVDYNVRTTPQVFVLDRDRKIIAKKLDVGEQLLSFLEEYQRLNP